MERPSKDSSVWRKEYTRRTITEWGRRLPLTPGGYAESIDAEWKEAAEEPRTLVTQARLAYVFCHCSRLGNKELQMLVDAELSKLAVASIRRLMSVFWKPELRGWIRATDKFGKPIDTTIDSYGQSFGLFALALDYRVRNNSETRNIALRVLDALDEYAAAPSGGYFEYRQGGKTAPGLPFPHLRRLEPHMYLFEAFISWYAVDHCGPWLEKAQSILKLLREKFLQPDGSLAAYFDNELNLAEGEAGKVRTVGDHYEWAWLLGQYEKFTGDSSMREYAKSMFAFAENYGKDSTGFAFSEVDSAGNVLDGSRLLWMQFERFKSYVAMYDWTGDHTFLDTADKIRLRIRDTYLHHKILFYNKLDAEGNPDLSPSRTRFLYHFFMAACELDRVLTPSDPGEMEPPDKLYPGLP
jgi:mannose/cellobiose epimerase-like protein (N-acyl-D-glucosamine 2-epimerase family)